MSTSLSGKCIGSFPMVPLGEVLTRSLDTIPILSDHAYKEVTVRLWGKGVVLRRETSGSEIKADRRTPVKSGQFILSKIDARNGAFGIVPDELDGAVVSNDFPVFNASKDRLFPKYLEWLSKTRDFIDLCKASSEGTTNRVRLKEQRFLAACIPLPPLSEQKRIVKRIEEVAAKIEEARALMSEISESSHALKASVSFQLFANLAKGTVVAVEEVCEVRGGIQKCHLRIPGANPRRYITVAHVQRNNIDLGNPRYFEVSDSELKLWQLHAGDVLVIEGNGSAEQIGRAALFRGKIENCVHQNHVIRVRPDQDQLMPEYLNAYFNSPAGRQEMLERSRTTSGLYNLSVGRIRDIRIPLPLLETQGLVVAELSAFQDKTDALAVLEESSTKENDALLPSVLAKAFRGEL